MARTTKTKPKEKPFPQREDILAALGKAFDTVDAAIAKRRISTRVNLSSWSNMPALDNARTAIGGLCEDLELIENPEGEEEHPGAHRAIVMAFADPPGDVPRWSRPGTFLVWLDYVPIRCVWGGFADQSAMLFAADPDVPWVSGDGWWSLHFHGIEPGCRSVADTFRREIANLGGPRARLELKRLDDEAIEAARKTLALPESEWLREALKRGPVDPVPLPQHLQAVQQRLFA
jgi:hypothetical protein